MTLANLVTEPYDRQARLYPALFALAPGIATAASSLAGQITWGQSIFGTATGLGGAFLLTQLARDGGKKREPSLVASWGGLPSVAILRHRDERIDSVTKGRYHKALSQLIAEAPAPTAEQENSDPAAADKVYTAWSTYLRTHTRNTKKFDLVFKENIAYGYRRNVLGLRPWGIAISAVCLILSGAHAGLIYHSTSTVEWPILFAFLFALVFLCLWLFRVTSDWVRVPADAYAERLAETTDALAAEVAAPPKPPPKPKKKAVQ